MNAELVHPAPPDFTLRKPGLITVHLVVLEQASEPDPAQLTTAATAGHLVHTQLIRDFSTYHASDVSRPITGAARFRHGLSSPAQTLGSWIRIPLEAWMSVYVYSEFVLSCMDR
jgi:hypothetical protein